MNKIYAHTLRMAQNSV